VIFVDREFDPATAGWLLAFSSIVGLTGSMAAPMLATRLRQQRAVAAGLTAVAALGMLGILLLPGAEVVSMALLGTGQGAALGLSLTLMVLRSPDTAHAAQLSGMAQCVGYIGAAAGPFAVGALHDLTGTWTALILFLLAAFAGQATMGVLAGRDRLVAGRAAAQVGSRPASHA
jgi:MFS transporter, CP family, cyanate transporter